MLERSGPALTALGLGAGLMYLLDPERGRRRRAMMRDRVAHATRLVRDATDTTTRDMAHRASGVAARVRDIGTHESPDDRVLVERVRAQLGRVVSHPGAILVNASDGVATLRGPVLTAEMPRLLSTVRGVRSVREVVDELEPHDEAGDIPALRGGAGVPGPRLDILQHQWSPTTRLLTGAAGAALAGYGAARRGPAGAVLTTAGLGLFARAATNLDTRRMKTLLATGRAPRDAAQPQIH
jgi:hypothetical protein